MAHLKRYLKGELLRSPRDQMVSMLVRNIDEDTSLDWDKNLLWTSAIPNLDRLKVFLQGQALVHALVDKGNLWPRGIR